MSKDQIILPNEDLRRIHIFLTTSCNLRCIMCSAKDKLDINPPIELQPETLIKMAQSIQHPTRFVFTGGEPLVYFNKYTDVLKEISNNENIHLFFITNGLLLNDNILDILSSTKRGFTIAFSVDGYKEIYNEIRIGSSWDKIDGKIRQVSQMTKNSSKNHLFVRYVIMNKNIYCYEDLVQHALNYWDVIHIENDLLITDSKRSNEYLMPNKLDKEEFVKILDDMRHKWPQVDIQEGGTVIVQKDLYENIVTIDNTLSKIKRFCNVPFYALAVYYDGNIVPCCNSTNFCLGNLATQDIYEIWNGQAIKELRANICNGNKHSACLCNAITLRKGKKFNDEKFTGIKNRIANSSHERKKQINNLIQEYKYIYKSKNEVGFLENSDISPFDKFSIPAYSELAGMYLYRLKNYQKAEEMCDIILNIYPNHYDTLMKKSIIKFNLNQKEKAIQIMQEQVLSHQEKEHSLAYFWLGYFYEQYEEKKAYIYYQKFINCSHVDIDSWGYQHSIEWLKENK